MHFLDMGSAVAGLRSARTRMEASSDRKDSGLAPNSLCRAKLRRDSDRGGDALSRHGVRSCRAEVRKDSNGGVFSVYLDPVAWLCETSAARNESNEENREI